MNSLRTAPQSLRSARARALAPRIAVYFALLILSVAGLRAIIDHSSAPPGAPAPLAETASDPAAEAFAEGFADVYLSWDADKPQRRRRALLGYLPSSLDEEDGFTPADGTSQRVVWTAAMGAERFGSTLNVTVAARTTDGDVLHLTVPVARDENGFLYVAGYPALVGAPPLARDATPPQGEEVEDETLKTVVERALINYLAGARENLLADLAPEAVVSLPARKLTVSSVETPTWVVPNHRVAAVVTATDEEESTWTLRYELAVRRGDRWYVAGIEVDPTLKGRA